MAVAQGLSAAVVVLAGGSSSGIGNRNGGFSSSVAQTVCSANPGSGTSQQVAVSVASHFVSSLVHTPSRGFNGGVGLQRIACALSGNEVAVGNAHVGSATKLDVAPVVEEMPCVEESPATAAPETSISGFMADIANLVKLVDSRDIVELELKHKEYELIIRKEVQQPPPPSVTFPGPHVMAHTTFPGYAPSPPPPMHSLAPVGVEPAPVAAAAPPPAPPPKPAKPSHPPMLSPMAGTFYRSPAPGEAAFLQVGDRVTKGQVVCIVEAMKLMNEIEADRSGTLVEILADDGKPISIESPLFSIEP